MRMKQFFAIVGFPLRLALILLTLPVVFIVSCIVGPPTERTVREYTSWLLTGRFVNPRELATRYADHLNHFDTAACPAERASIDRAYNENIDLEIAYLNKVRAAIEDDKKLKELISGDGRKDLRYSVVPCGVLRRLGMPEIK